MKKLEVCAMFVFCLAYFWYVIRDTDRRRRELDRHDREVA